jgi:hypothetical protein
MSARNAQDDNRGPSPAAFLGSRDVGKGRAEKCTVSRPNDQFLQYKNPRSLRVRYLFVICGFSLAETEKANVAFLLGRAPETEGSEPF